MRQMKDDPPGRARTGRRSGRDVATRAGTGVPELHDADGLVPGHGGERQPKDARTAGAHAVARLLPNRLRTAGVSTTTAELTGTSEPDPSASSSPWGNPRALSAAHITGSQ